MVKDNFRKKERIAKIISFALCAALFSFLIAHQAGAVVKYGPGTGLGVGSVKTAHIYNGTILGEDLTSSDLTKTGNFIVTGTTTSAEIRVGTYGTGLAFANTNAVPTISFSATETPSGWSALNKEGWIFQGEGDGNGFHMFFNNGLGTWNATSTMDFYSNPQALTVFNEDNHNWDFLVEGDTDSALFRVDASADKVGISSSTPTYLLSVGDNFGVNSSGVVAPGTWNGTAIGAQYGGTGLTSATAGNLIIGNSASALQATSSIFINPTGMIGIGTLTPLFSLQVQKNSDTDWASTTRSNIGMAIRNETSGAKNSTGLAFKTETNGEVILNAVENDANTAADFVLQQYTGSGYAEDLRVLGTNGNVGIGTSTPQAKLEIGNNGGLRVVGGTAPTTPTFGNGLTLTYDQDGYKDGSVGGDGLARFLSMNHDTGAYTDLNMLADQFLFKTGSNNGLVINPNGWIATGLSSSTANLEISPIVSNATTTFKLGKAAQNKGSCFVLYDTTGTTTYAVITGGAWVLSTTSCQ